MATMWTLVVEVLSTCKRRQTSDYLHKKSISDGSYEIYVRSLNESKLSNNEIPAYIAKAIDVERSLCEERTSR